MPIVGTRHATLYVNAQTNETREGKMLDLRFWIPRLIAYAIGAWMVYEASIVVASLKVALATATR